MKNVCVFLSASNVDQKYVVAGEKFGTLLAQNNYGYVYGGSDKGLMKVVADAVRAAKGKVIGVSMELLRNVIDEKADEMIIAPDLPQRKKLLNEKSDAIVVLVGGVGTLDEVTEIIELKKHGVNPKPIIFLNTDNFYAGLKMQLEKMETEGFLTQKLHELVEFANEPEEVIDILNKRI